jgi:hypothetical protein
MLEVIRRHPMKPRELAEDDFLFIDEEGHYFINGLDDLEYFEDE